MLIDHKSLSLIVSSTQLRESRLQSWQLGNIRLLIHKSVNLRAHSCDFQSEVDSLICTLEKQQTSSITFKITVDQALKTNSWKTNQAEFFCARLYKFLPTNLGVCKPTFYIFYHTDLGQNAVFHNFSRQIALSQYSGRSIVGFQRSCSKNFQNHPYGQFSFLQCELSVWGRVFTMNFNSVTLQHNNEFIITIICYKITEIVRVI